MTYLSFFARLSARCISRFTSFLVSHDPVGRRAHSLPLLLILLLVIALLSAQPLLVNAEPAARSFGQLAEIAQITPTLQEEATEENEQEDEEGDDEEIEATAEATADPDEEAPPADQPNIILPTAEASEAITLEIPLDEEPAAEDIYTLPFAWEGDATISAQELAEVAPPFQAEVSQGDFQIAFVPAETGGEAEDVLRILPVAEEGTLSSLRLGVKVDEKSADLPMPAGQTLLVQLSARVYAPEATARLIVADNNGSSSTLLEGLNWSDYQVTRQIDAAATELEIIVEWRNVPANGWLEMRGFSLSLLPQGEVAALSPTDTPSVIAETPVPATVAPSPTPAAAAIATATPLLTATPLPETVTEEVTGTGAVTETVILTPTPTLVIVTSTPTPVDVFEEATRVAQATEWARILGPATPTPPNMATATPTPTPFIIAIVHTPTPSNAATATDVALRATAIAFTTGTPTPYPAEATVLVATPTSPPPTRTARPTATATPIFVLVENIPVTTPAPTPPVPAILQGKIVFLTAYRGNPRQPNAMVINPDGSELGLMTTNFFYTLAAGRDMFSADRRYKVFALREAGGEAHNAGSFQIFYDDLFYNSFKHQLTYHGAGVAWAPVWSPTGETIAYVSSETGNDEIWVTQRGQWPGTQLTHNEWEWDHHPSFSPNGSEIVFSSNRIGGRRQLWIMSASGENPRQLTNLPYEAWDPVWVKYTGGEMASCDPNYPGICIPLATELTCADVGEAGFVVMGSDPHGFDHDGDGIGCEK
jgi:hypothetical protein